MVVVGITDVVEAGVAIQSETLTVYKGVENRVYSPVQDGREPLYSNNGVSPMLSGRIDPFSTPLYNGRNKLFPPSTVDDAESD